MIYQFFLVKPGMIADFISDGVKGSERVKDFDRKVKYSTGFSQKNLHNLHIFTCILQHEQVAYDLNLPG